MLTFDVSTFKELRAAVKAIAQPTHADARANPAFIAFGTTRYYFHEGITERRANQILKNMKGLK